MENTLTRTSYRSGKGLTNLCESAWWGGAPARCACPLVEYLPVSRDSSFGVVEMEETASADPVDPSRAEAIGDFFRLHNRDRADSLFRGAILSWIGR
ncbi:MAG TPA: hypothetical protein PLV91_06720 [Verrucomicrobiota bacterium]|nr:hypothetical protein [Verrucomicrobiota bacterium]